MSTDIHALAGAYALDAVDDVERAAFERHLAECGSCRTELAELREAASRLADSTWSVPPPRLRGDVMTAIGRTRQLPPQAQGPSRPVARQRRGRWLISAAAAVVLACGASTAVYQVQEHRVREERAIAQAAQQRELRTRQILAAADLVMKSGPMVGGGTVTVAMSPAHNAGVVLVGAVSPPPAGRVYQLWAIHGTTPVNAGVLAAGQLSAVEVVEGMGGTSMVGVTAEPPGGSATPTTAMTMSQISLA